MSAYAGEFKSQRPDEPEYRWKGAGGRWKDLKLNAAPYFPHPAFLQSEAVGSTGNAVSHESARKYSSYKSLS
jgi:hypothetical protein